MVIKEVKEMKDFGFMVKQNGRQDAQIKYRAQREAAILEQV